MSTNPTKEVNQPSLYWHDDTEFGSPKEWERRAIFVEILSVILALGAVIGAYFCFKMHYYVFAVIPLTIGIGSITALFVSAINLQVWARKNHKEEMENPFIRFKDLFNFNTYDLTNVKTASPKLGVLVRLGLLTVEEAAGAKSIVKSVKNDRQLLAAAQATVDDYELWKTNHSNAWTDLEKNPQNYPKYTTAKQEVTRLTRELSQNTKWSEFQNRLKGLLDQRIAQLEAQKQKGLPTPSSKIQDSSSWFDRDAESNCTAINATLAAIGIITLIGAIIGMYFCFSTHNAESTVIPGCLGSPIGISLSITALVWHINFRQERKKELTESAKKDASIFALKSNKLETLKTGLFGNEKANFGPLVRTGILTAQEAEFIKALIADHQSTTEFIHRCIQVGGDESKAITYPSYFHAKKRLESLQKSWKTLQAQMTAQRFLPTINS